MPSKGIHLLVDRLSDQPLILSASVKGQVFFVLPVDAEQSLVGTTDTAVTGPIDQVTAETQDIAELLRQLFRYFPQLKEGATLPEAIERYKRTHVRSFYWGVRPLLAQQGTSTLHASREHQLVKELPQFWSFAGVKLTAGRVAGETAAQEAWAFLRAGIPKPVYVMDSLPGGELWDMDRFVRDAQKRFNLGPHSEERIHYLVRMYGTRYVQVLALSQTDPQLGMSVMPGEPWVLAQAAYAAREEMVLTLNDFLWRRTKWARYADLPAEALEAIARVLGQELQWSEERIAQELQNYRDEKKKHQL
jgi:glycerol-3-phosphate dehydrogenase